MGLMSEHRLRVFNRILGMAGDGTEPLKERLQSSARTNNHNYFKWQIKNGLQANTCKPFRIAGTIRHYFTTKRGVNNDIADF